MPTRRAVGMAPGAKEIGEGFTLPVLGAVAHAIANATGAWIKDLPITAEKILQVPREKEEKAESVGNRRDREWCTTMR